MPDTVRGYIKRRSRPSTGSIPDVLDMFRAEVRFYQEIAPVVGVRVPACYLAESGDEGTCLVLEDLSAWQPGADPAVAVCVLAEMHRTWENQVHRWPWLRPVGAAADLVNDLFDRTWPHMLGRPDLTQGIRALGERLVGQVTEVERAAALAGPATLVHGDASLLNMRTGPDGEVVLLDWEDVSAGPGALDLAWLLLSSVEPARWDEVTAAYGSTDGLAEVLPAVAVQGLLCLSDIPDGSSGALSWTARLEAAARLWDQVE